MRCAATLISMLHRQRCFHQIKVCAPGSPSAVVNSLQWKGLIEWDAPVATINTAV